MKNKFSIFILCLITIILFNTLYVSAADDENEKDVIVTIYNQNFAQIREIRAKKMKKGNEEWNLTDLPPNIEPDSIFFEFYKQDETCEIIEQNYRFDLKTPDTLLSRYLFAKDDLEIYFNNGSKLEGKMVYFDDKNIILGEKKEDAEPLIITRDTIKHIKFPEHPDGLITKPTLSCKLKTSHKAYYKVALTYLVNGLDWSTNYTGLINTSSDEMRLIGNVSIKNSLSFSFNNVKLNLVAGKVHKKNEIAASSEKTVTEGHGQEDKLLNYHFYSLERKADVKENSVKQMPLFNFEAVKMKMIYTYNGRTDNDRAKVSLSLVNDSLNGLGVSLPEGKIKLYNRDASGVPVLVGEDYINNVPIGKTIKLTLGKAFDISGDRREMETKKLDTGEIEKVIEIEMTNHKKQQVNIAVTENIDGVWEITEKNEEYIKKDSKTIEFNLLIPADSKKIIRYKVKITK